MDDAVDLISDFLPQLLDLVARSDLRELEVREGDVAVRLHRAPPREIDSAGGEAPMEFEPEPAAEEIPTEYAITAPLVGTFYRASGPGMPPLISEGSRVEDETVVGIIEALNVLTEVEAGATGVVIDVLATDGQPVEYGQVLFQVNLHG